MIQDPNMNDGYSAEMNEAEVLRTLDWELRTDEVPQEPSAYAPPTVQPAAPARTRNLVKKPTPQKRQDEYTWDSTTGNFELDRPPQQETWTPPVVLPQPEIRGYGD